MKDDDNVSAMKGDSSLVSYLATCISGSILACT